MRKNFADLTENEKFDLVATYIKSKDSLSTDDLILAASCFGVSAVMVVNEFIVKFPPAYLAVIPAYGYWMYRVVKNHKKFKKATNKKVGYFRVRAGQLTGSMKKLSSKYSPEERKRRNLQAVFRFLGIEFPNREKEEVKKPKENLEKEQNPVVESTAQEKNEFKDLQENQEVKAQENGEQKLENIEENENVK